MGVGQFQIGEHSYGTIQVIGRSGTVKVGKFCSIAGNVSAIMVGHRIDWITTYPFGAREIRSKWPHAIEIVGHPQVYGDIEIGSDVWIGQNVTLMGGISIGHGAVIAASSLVVKDVPQYALVGGVPSTILKYRFDPDRIEALLRIAWWDWPDDVIAREVKHLCSKNVDEFIRRFS